MNSPSLASQSGSSSQGTKIQSTGRPTNLFSASLISISIKDQILSFKDKTYSISSAANGLGEEEGSFWPERAGSISALLYFLPLNHSKPATSLNKSDFGFT
jgi:hypothetical protein